MRRRVTMGALGGASATSPDPLEPIAFYGVAHPLVLP